MRFRERMVNFSMDRPVLVTALMIVVTAAMAVLVPFVGIKVDTDPENMLSYDEAVRVFHRLAKKEFTLHDFIVLGIVNEKDPDGVFNPSSLRKIKKLTDTALALSSRTTEDGRPWVRSEDLLAPSTVDNVSQNPQGGITFSYLMEKVPETREEALKIRREAMEHPLFHGTLVSEDGKALCLYIPISEKSLAYKVAQVLRAEIAKLGGPERYFITGLPIAEDQFGVEMFVQMAISAPTAMLFIFLLMLLFFRKLVLIISPMIIAIVSVIGAMGLLISTGHTVHIMSSMIPIFLMPIAVVDSVHILSEFFDRYPSIGDRRKTCRAVIDTLFMPMLYTSLTSAAGFASLALTPIPPVQVFGLFVAFGIMVAWVWTILFIPAYVMFIPERRLEGFGLRKEGRTEEGGTALSRLLARVGKFTYSRAKPILGVTALVAAVAVYGITKIQINDNPVKWFTEGHEIRVADRVLNAHFGGTYEAYLVLEAPEGTKEEVAETAKQLSEKLDQALAEAGKNADPALREAFSSVQLQAKKLIAEIASKVDTRRKFLQAVQSAFGEKSFEAEGEAADAWQIVSEALDPIFRGTEVFKRPEVLRYIESLQKALVATGVVGKSNSLADLVKKVYQELQSGKREDLKIPPTAEGVAECLQQVQNSHDPDDLWHFVTPDYRKVNIWVQLRSGDNKDMTAVAEAVERFFKENPPKEGCGVDLRHSWAGLTYINVVWQSKMVAGMLQSFLGSFLVVFLLMSILFQSPLWGGLSMVPLSVTILVIYGAIGLIGKDYDMPVAVLSALSLGIAVDFAIHFLERTRMAVAKYGTWEAAVGPMFDEPARAITRNVIVIAIGFTPLLLAPLVPYKTVGVFLASIMAVSGVATLLLLPAAVRLLQKALFKERSRKVLTCNCVLCIGATAVSVVVIALNLHQYAGVPFEKLTYTSLIVVIAAALLCAVLTRRRACRVEVPPEEEGGVRENVGETEAGERR